MTSHISSHERVVITVPLLSLVSAALSPTPATPVFVSVVILPHLLLFFCRDFAQSVQCSCRFLIVRKFLLCAFFFLHKLPPRYYQFRCVDESFFLDDPLESIHIFCLLHPSQLLMDFLVCVTTNGQSSISCLLYAFPLFSLAVHKSDPADHMYYIIFISHYIHTHIYIEYLVGLF